MRNALVVLAGIFLTTACSTSKFDYQTAYKFSHYPHHTKPTLEVIEPVASLTPIQMASPEIPSDRALKKINEPQNASSTLVENYRNASKKEKKAIRQQVKEEFKTLRMEVKKAKKEAKANDITFNKKIYIGLIILAAGILVAILASGPVGAVAIIVGIGIIAWGFIEQA